MSHCLFFQLSEELGEESKSVERCIEDEALCTVALSYYTVLKEPIKQLCIKIGNMYFSFQKDSSVEKQNKKYFFVWCPIIQLTNCESKNTMVTRNNWANKNN